MGDEKGPDPYARRGRWSDHGRARMRTGHNMDLGQLWFLLNKTRPITRTHDFGME